MLFTERHLPKRSFVEWPTLALAICIYCSWLLVLAMNERLHFIVNICLLGVIIAWHSSFQHESIHGHPFREKALNELIASPPLCLWVPYAEYRDTHLKHHIDEHLTDPHEDPESYYLTPEQWQTMSPMWRRVMLTNRTFLGRVTIGPFLSIFGWLRSRAHAVIHNEPGARRVWGAHALQTSLILYVVTHVAGVSLFVYLPAVVLSQSLLMVRSFCEHKWVSNGASRVAMVSLQ